MAIISHYTLLTRSTSIRNAQNILRSHVDSCGILKLALFQVLTERNFLDSIPVLGEFWGKKYLTYIYKVSLLILITHLTKFYKLF
jgi:hypothetical protein